MHGRTQEKQRRRLLDVTAFLHTSLIKEAESARSSKRALSIATAIIRCLGLALPVWATEDDFDIKDGLLKHYRGHDANVVIPGSVTEIGKSASLTAVTP